MNEIIVRLNQHLNEVPKKLKAIPESELTKKPMPGKWSRKEVLGHLVDSAIYNIVRFTEAQYLPQPYVVEGYAQDKLVAVNDYQNLPLEHILLLWEKLNRQIIFILERIPQEKFQTPIIRKGEEKTLGWLAEDYVQHLEHHLAQVFF